MSDLIRNRAPFKKEIEQISSTHSVGYPVRHFNQVELSRRWAISPRTLERWRWLGEGPPYLRVGGRILYRLKDVEAYEAKAFVPTIDFKAGEHRT